MSYDPTVLKKRCSDLNQGFGMAIDWIREVRETAPGLNRVANSMVHYSRLERNKATRLAKALDQPVSIGFFGMSQGGKSYLISSLAAGGNGQLEFDLGAERLNFIQHINPVGGGKEATGLVTRFTRQPYHAPDKFPIHLSLFSEADVIKVLGNSFFNDFDHQRVKYDTDPTHIRAVLLELERQALPDPQPGISADDVVDIQAYFEDHFSNAMKPLAGDYWPTAVELAPVLSPANRAKLFSVLWGQIMPLTDVYTMLRSALEQANFADVIYAPIHILVERDARGNWVQGQNIMNVDILEKLGDARDDVIEVLPSKDGTAMDPIRLPRATLAALTAEIRFQLAEAPQAEMLEHTDLLDFPGYRGRLSITSLNDVRTQMRNEQVDPVAQLVLRGKVAYLFERYTTQQVMNLLVMCTPSHKQMDVNTLGPALDEWVSATQGGNPQMRQEKETGLFWAVTMFDFKLAPVPDQTEDMMRIGWQDMLKMTVMERFGQYSWIHEWRAGQAFNNIFLVRKPCMAAGIIETRNGRELDLLPDQSARLAQLQRSFLDSEMARKYILDAPKSWDEMIGMNNGGIRYLIERLKNAARVEYKLKRIEEQIDEMTERTLSRLGYFYHREGAGALAEKNKMVKQIIAALAPRAGRFAELMHALQLNDERLLPVYLRSKPNGEPNEDAETEPEKTSNMDWDAMDALVSLDLGMNDAPEHPASEVKSDHATSFAHDAMADWIQKMRSLSENESTPIFLGLPVRILDQIVDELVTAADRVQLEPRLAQSLAEGEKRVSVMRQTLAQRQVLVAQRHINNFLAYLDLANKPLEARPFSMEKSGRRAFEPPPPISGRNLPQLSKQPFNFSGRYIMDWFGAFEKLAQDNAGYTAGREISPQQNARLGEILELIDSRSDAPPSLEKTDD